MGRLRMWLPAEIDGEMDQRLKNWGEFCRTPQRSRASVSRGVEGRYRPCDEPGFVPEPFAERSPWAPVIDGADAEVIHGVVMHPSFPAWHKVMLAGHYRDQVHPRRLHRQLGIRWVEYNRVLGAALLVVRNRLPRAPSPAEKRLAERFLHVPLTSPETVGYAPRHNSTSASSRGAHGAAGDCVAPVRESIEAPHE